MERKMLLNKICLLLVFFPVPSSFSSPFHVPCFSHFPEECNCTTAEPRTWRKFYTFFRDDLGNESVFEFPFNSSAIERLRYIAKTTENGRNGERNVFNAQFYSTLILCVGRFFIFHIFFSLHTNTNRTSNYHFYDFEHIPLPGSTRIYPRIAFTRPTKRRFTIPIIHSFES